MKAREVKELGETLSQDFITSESRLETEELESLQFAFDEVKSMISSNSTAILESVIYCECISIIHLFT
jgi:hypothetical protein